MSGTLFFEVFIGADPGIVGRVHLVLASEGIIPGISLHGEFVLEFSTYSSTYEAYTFGINHDGTLKRDVHDVDQDGITDELLLEETAIEPGLRIKLAGYLNIADILRLDGIFTFHIGDELDIFVDASIVLEPLGSFDVTGWLHIDGEGLTALIDISLDFGFGGDAGLSFTATARLEINTTNREQPVPVSNLDPANPPARDQDNDPRIAPGFRLHIDGTITFLGFAEGNGFVDVLISVNGIQLQFGVDFTLWGLSFGAHGGAGLYADSNPGMALFLDVYVIADAEVFDIEATGKLQINTCNVARMGIDANLFYLSLNGHVEILEVLKFNAGFTIQVGGSLGVGEWRFDFDAGIDFFSIVTLQGYGFLDSRGNFDINLYGYMQLGPNGFCVKGGFNFRIFDP